MKVSIACLCLVASLTSNALAAPHFLSRSDGQSIARLRSLFVGFRNTDQAKDSRLQHSDLDPSDDRRYNEGDEKDVSKILTLLPYIPENESPSELAHLADLTTLERAHFGPADYGDVSAPSAQIQEYQLHRLQRLRHCQQAMADGGNMGKHYGDLVVVTFVMLFLVGVLMVEVFEKLCTRVRNRFRGQYGAIQLSGDEKAYPAQALSPLARSNSL
ncbi:MAG: hypothetical protein M1812_005673 [Candelaria pacifica]|nr:MAG: hypothetical protein M1812_005673 [Candelaria pacifica]